MRPTAGRPARPVDVESTDSVGRSRRSFLQRLPDSLSREGDSSARRDFRPPLLGQRDQHTFDLGRRFESHDDVGSIADAGRPPDPTSP